MQKYETPVRFSRLAFLGRRETKDAEFLINDLIYRDSMCGLVGQPGSLKTLIVGDMCASVGTGEPWFGRRVEQGAAFLVLGEGNNRIYRRFKAIEVDRKLSLRRAPIFVSNMMDSLSWDSAAEAISDRIMRASEKIGAAPAIICVDPLSKAIAPGDENSAADMGKFLANLDKHFRNRFKCAVVVVHHTGHGKTDRARGSSAFRAWLDTEMVVSRSDDRVEIRCTMQKDAAEFQPITLRAEVVALPPIGDEEAQTSVALREGQPKSTHKKQDDALLILRRLMKDARGNDVRQTDWCHTALDQGLVSSAKAFAKLRARLKERGLIEYKDGAVKAVPGE